MISDSPDTERFIMLFLHRYPALPLIIPQDSDDASTAFPAIPQPVRASSSDPETTVKLNL